MEGARRHRHPVPAALHRPHRQRRGPPGVRGAPRLVTSFRSTLAAHGFIEVETPILHLEAGGAHARPFATHHNTLDLDLHLRIALELHLKRLIVGGLERVFEIGRVFRNEGLSTRHNPEFTMLELYQAFADYTDVMTITETLVTQGARDALGTTIVSIGDEKVDLARPWPRATMTELTSEALGEEVHPSMPVARLRDLADARSILWQPHWGSGKLIEELYEATVEDGLTGPVFVTGHPVEISRWLAWTGTIPSSPSGSSCTSEAGSWPTATASSTTRSSSGTGSRTSSGPRRPATSAPAASTRTTCGRSSTACRPRAGWASASTASPCSSPG